MVPELRKGVLLVEGAVHDEDEEVVELEEKAESESTIDTGYQSEESRDNENDNREKDKAQERRDYQISVLRQIQFIFGHLAHSELQFHIPKGFWNTFK